MVYTGQAPASAFFTPPQRLSGSSAFWMSLLGKKADGTSNTFGDILGWIPGTGIAQQLAAQAYAKSTGLKDVQDNVNDGMDTKLSQLQAGLGVAKVVGGAVMGNPALITGGVGDVATGISGGISGSEADKELAAERNRRISWRAM